MADLAFVKKELADLFRGTTYTRPSTWYIGLDTNSTGAYAEPTYGGYSRSGVTRGTSTWTDPASTGQTSNVSTITFPTVPSGYSAGEVIRRIFLVDRFSSSGETVFDYVTLTTPVTLAATLAPQLAAGAVIVGI